MSTVKIAVCWMACCLVGSVAWGQYDVPPALPDFAAPPAVDAAPVFPELPTTPAAKPRAAVPRIQTSATAERPRQRLSAESTANLPKQVQNLIDFYGGATSARALAQLPQRPVSGVSRPPAPRPVSKPFTGALQSAAPTISPYMNLYLEESPEGLPNYHSYVRPAFQQREANMAARRSLHTLERQVQQVSYGQAVGPATGGGAVPGTGHGTRYFNTTQFYPATPRLR